MRLHLRSQAPRRFGRKGFRLGLRSGAPQGLQGQGAGTGAGIHVRSLRRRLLGLLPEVPSQPNPLRRNMFVHAVYFWLKPDISTAQTRQFEELANAMSK